MPANDAKHGPNETHPLDGETQSSATSKQARRLDSAGQMGWPLRTVSLLAGLAVLSLLVTARSLEPSDSGIGTHQQLGLPPCTSIAIFGIRCPACGMTTSWAHLLRGELRKACRANTGGAMLGAIALATVPVSCYFFVRGRPSRGGRYSFAVAIGLLAAMAVAVIQWFFVWL